MLAAQLAYCGNYSLQFPMHVRDGSEGASLITLGWGWDIGLGFGFPYLHVEGILLPSELYLAG